MVDGSEGPDLESEVERLRERTAALESELEEARHDQPRRHRGRGIAAVALLVLGSILAPISILAVWTRNQISDTNRYLDTVAPLASDPAIQQAAANQITAALFAQIDIQKQVGEALPENAQFLAGPLTSALRSAVSEATLRVLQSDQFQRVWIDANRIAHNQLVAVLTGNGSNAIKTTDSGAVEINLSGIIDVVNQQLQQNGIDLFSNVSLPQGAVTIEIFQSNDITRAQVAFSAFDKVATLLPWLTLVLLAAGVVLMSSRRRGLMWAGAGVSVGVLVLLLGVAIGRTVYLGAIPSTVVSHSAAAAFFDTIVQFLRQGARLILAIALLVFVASIVLGPSPSAVRLRSWVSRMLGRVGDEATDRGVEFGEAGQFVGRNLVALRIVVGVLAVGFLILWDRPTATLVFVVTLIALVALGALEVVGRSARAREIAPGPSEPSTS